MEGGEKCRASASEIHPRKLRKRSASDGNFCPKKVELQYHWAIGSMREKDCYEESFHAVCSMSSLGSPLLQPKSNANKGIALRKNTD